MNLFAYTKVFCPSHDISIFGLKSYDVLVQDAAQTKFLRSVLILPRVGAYSEVMCTISNVSRLWRWLLRRASTENVLTEEICPFYLRKVVDGTIRQLSFAIFFPNNKL